ncbi:MAG: ribosome maturation factor RimP [bacterium]
MEDRDRRIFDLVEPGVASQGVELVEVSVAPSRHRTFVRIVVHSRSGITHADCERVTRVAGRILDDAEAIPGSYVLEVSSPGLERVLKTPREFDVFRGRLIRLQMSDEPTEIVGRSAGTRGAEVALSREEGELVVPWTRVARARLLPEPAGVGGEGK